MRTTAILILAALCGCGSVVVDDDADDDATTDHDDDARPDTTAADADADADADGDLDIPDADADTDDHEETPIDSADADADDTTDDQADAADHGHADVVDCSSSRIDVCPLCCHIGPVESVPLRLAAGEYMRAELVGSSVHLSVDGPCHCEPSMVCECTPSTEGTTIVTVYAESEMSWSYDLSIHATCSVVYY